VAVTLVVGWWWFIAMRVVVESIWCHKGDGLFVDLCVTGSIQVVYLLEKKVITTRLIKKLTWKRGGGGVWWWSKIKVERLNFPHVVSSTKSHDDFGL
jgi:hypothetical protein